MITPEQAKEFYEHEGWKGMTHRERVDFQFSHGLVCMPMDILLESLADVFGRPVYNHELGLNWEGLKAELYEGKEPPTIEEIIGMLAATGKPVIIVKEE